MTWRRRIPESYPDTATLEPGTFSATVLFNAPVDPGAFNLATSFTPPIPGTWVGSSTSMRFVATTAYPLTPNTNYTLTVTGDVPLYRVTLWEVISAITSTSARFVS